MNFLARFFEAFRAAAGTPAADDTPDTPTDSYGQPLRDWPIGLSGSSRDVALRLPGVHRAATLLAGAIASMFVQGRVAIVDAARRRLRDEASETTLSVLAHSPDGLHSGQQWIEDFVADYALEGNALAVMTRRGKGDFVLDRLHPRGAHYVAGTQRGSATVRAVRVVYSADALVEMSWPALDIVHARWPLLGRAPSPGMAAPPLQALTSVVSAGTSLNDYVRRHFARPDKSDTVIQFGEDAQMTYTADQKVALIASTQNWFKTWNPLVLFGKSSTAKALEPKHGALDPAVRESLISEIGRVYGIPNSLLGISEKGSVSGIEELGRLWWKYGLKQHVTRILAALSFRLLPRGQRFAVSDFDGFAGDAGAIAALCNALGGDSNRQAVLSPDEMRDLLGVPAGEAPPGGNLPAVTAPGVDNRAVRT